MKNSKFVMSKKRHFSIIIVMAILVLLSGLLVGCNSQDVDSTVNEIESVEESTEDTTSESASAITEISEPKSATITLSASEYYVDYPLALEDGGQVYVKMAPNLHFYPDGVEVTSCLQRYEEMNELHTHLSMDSDNHVSEAGVDYGIEKDYELINWMMNPEGVEWSYKISEPETWDSGIIAYSLEQIWTSGKTNEQYILYYPLDDEYQVVININYFVGDLADEQLPEEQQAVLDFYRTEENAFVVVDPKEVDVVIGDTTDISALDTIKGTGAANAPTEKPEESASDVESKEESDSAEKSGTSTEKSKEDTSESQTSAHTHSYSSKVTQPTCTTQGYTTYTCKCGDSYKDNYTTGSHNYSNGTCINCGAKAPHEHAWVDKTWTEDKVTQTVINVYRCDCNIKWTTLSELDAHQDSIDEHNRNLDLSLSPDGLAWHHPDFIPPCTGWGNTSDYIETITQVTHHYRECACGAREDID